MEFQRARTKEQIENRQDEILSACADLYKDHNYDDITLKTISDKTSLSRTTMYSYYKTKEDIFIDLIKREYLTWNKELDICFKKEHNKTRDAFCHILTDSLVNKPVMLRLFSILLTILEKNCSVEQLIAFKKEVAVIFDTLQYGLELFFPDVTQAQKQYFIAEFLIFIQGVYPYMNPTEKQSVAMKAANISTPTFNMESLCYDNIYRLTLGL